MSNFTPISFPVYYEVLVHFRKYGVFRQLARCNKCHEEDVEELFDSVFDDARKTWSPTGGATPLTYIEACLKRQISWGRCHPAGEYEFDLDELPASTPSSPGERVLRDALSAISAAALPRRSVQLLELVLTGANRGEISDAIGVDERRVRQLMNQVAERILKAYDTTEGRVSA